VVTETLADLYRAQGYAAEARDAYSSLAEREGDAARRAALLEKAAAGAAPPSTPEARLREFLSRLPARRGTGIDDLAGVLRDLVSRVDGVTAATLTDLEGLPVVSAGRDSDAELEVLVAELTAFWKSVGRIDGELGAGSLETLALAGARGAAVVSSVSPDYALILRVEPGAPLGRIRYEAARTASLLGPALG
jgi:predicted regulator of Ras-like GTPase activity (Roadblock/LC7/MglB family)